MSCENANKNDECMIRTIGFENPTDKNGFCTVQYDESPKKSCEYYVENRKLNKLIEK